MGWSVGGDQFPKELFASKCVKCLDLHRKGMFAKPPPMRVGMQGWQSVFQFFFPRDK